MSSDKLIKPSIVVEGFDGCGKSTLVKALSEKLDLPVHHPGGPARGAVHARECAIQQLNLARQGVILDRITPISRLCYQSGHAAGLSLQDIWTQIRYLNAIREVAGIVWCVHKSDNHDTEAKDYDTPEHLSDIQDRAVEIQTNYAMIMSDISAIKYDFTQQSVESVIEELSCKTIWN